MQVGDVPVGVDVNQSHGIRGSGLVVEAVGSEPLVQRTKRRLPVSGIAVSYDRKRFVSQRPKRVPILDSSKCYGSGPRLRHIFQGCVVPLIDKLVLVNPSCFSQQLTLKRRAEQFCL